MVSPVVVDYRALAAPDPPLSAAGSPALRALAVLLGVGLLCATCLLVDRASLLARLARLRPGYVALGALIAVPQLALCTLRWRFTAGRLGVALGYRAALREYALSLCLNLLLPLGVLGDALRVLRHARRLQLHDQRAPTLRPALHAVLLERTSGQLVVAAWAGAAAPLWFGARAGGWLAGIACAAFALACGVRVWARAREVARLSGWRRLVCDFDRAFLSPRALAVQLGLSSAIVLTLVAQLCCALAALGLGLPLLAAVRIFPVMLLAMALPLSFAGFGAREAATAALYQATQLASSDGAAFALAYGAMTLMAALPAFALATLARGSAE
jgi:glycosyltransferase 2 family protein